LFVFCYLMLGAFNHMSFSKKLFSLAKSPLGDLIVGLAFGKFSKLLPVKRIVDNDRVIAFWHPKPFWEKHILIIPKKPIKKLTTVTEDDLPYIAEIYRVVKQIVTDLGWDKGGYSLITNGGSRQEVNQLHFHLCSGREVKP